LLFYRILRCVGNGGNLLDAVSIEVKQRDGRAFLGRQGAQGEVEVLMLEAGIGSRAADECPRLVDAIHGAASRLVVEESIVGYLEEPRAEPALVTITRQREVGLDQGILCQIISSISISGFFSMAASTICVRWLVSFIFLRTPDTMATMGRIQPHAIGTNISVR